MKLAEAVLKEEGNCIHSFEILHCHYVQSLHKAEMDTDPVTKHLLSFLPHQVTLTSPAPFRKSRRCEHIMELRELKQGPFSTISNHFDSKKWNMKTTT